MKANKLTPGHNLMWESSRMMLPEHKEEINRYRRGLTKKTKPLYDSQHTEELSRMVQQYLQSDVELFITVFGEFQDRELRGRITKVDQQLQRIKIEWVENEETEFEWISFWDIVDIFV